jgi:hypothetical protein
MDEHLCMKKTLMHLISQIKEVFKIESLDSYNLYLASPTITVGVTNITNWAGSIHIPLLKEGAKVKNTVFQIKANHFVVTLALNLRPKQGLVRLRAKKKARESHRMLPGV